MNAESRTQSGDIVTLEHIFFSYRTNSGGTRSVLRDVNLSLKPHHRIGLYGPNRSGKTTLLRCNGRISELCIFPIGYKQLSAFHKHIPRSEVSVIGRKIDFLTLVV